MISFQKPVNYFDKIFDPYNSMITMDYQVTPYKNLAKVCYNSEYSGHLEAGYMEEMVLGLDIDRQEIYRVIIFKCRR